MRSLRLSRGRQLRHSSRESWNPGRHGCLREASLRDGWRFSLTGAVQGSKLKVQRPLPNSAPGTRNPERQSTHAGMTYAGLSSFVASQVHERFYGKKRLILRREYGINGPVGTDSDLAAAVPVVPFFASRDQATVAFLAAVRAAFALQRRRFYPSQAGLDQIAAVRVRFPAAALEALVFRFLRTIP